MAFHPTAQFQRRTFAFNNKLGRSYSMLNLHCLKYIVVCLPLIFVLCNTFFNLEKSLGKGSRDYKQSVFPFKREKKNANLGKHVRRIRSCSNSLMRKKVRRYLLIFFAIVKIFATNCLMRG